MQDSTAEAAIERAKALISAAISQLYPHCGEAITIGLVAQLAEEFALAETLYRSRSPSKVHR